MTSDINLQYEKKKNHLVHYQIGQAVSDEKYIKLCENEFY